MRNKKQSYKIVIQKMTGWSDTEYNRKYNVYQKRVSNFNRLTGSHYSAQKELYYSIKYADDPSLAQSAIEATPTRKSTRAESVAGDYISQKFSGLISENRGLKAIQEQYQNGEISITEYAQKIRNAADELHRRRKDNPLYGSDNIELAE